MTSAIDVIIPARDEEQTVADVVKACRACTYVREVIVVDDGSIDATGERARAAGAKLVHGDAEGKGEAMAEGVDASDADAFLFVDGDCLNLTPAHLDDICRPFVENRAVMSLGTFDYGIWNWVVLRLPPTTGERIVPRWVFAAVPPEKRRGYRIEIAINEVVAERRLPTVARVMRGVAHRTKREKFGPLEGWRRTWEMFWLLVGMVRVVRVRSYWFYLRNLAVET